VSIEFSRDLTKKSVSLTLAPATKTHSVAKPVVVDRVWETLGLKLTTIEEAEFRQLNSRYRGGLRVTAVRADSPAAAQGIRRNDVLVGMHVWETISLENVAYILDREDLAKLDPMVFYIVRGSDTLYGHLRVASRSGTAQ
jgi:serine protease Do